MKDQANNPLELLLIIQSKLGAHGFMASVWSEYIAHAPNYAYKWVQSHGTYLKVARRWSQWIADPGLLLVVQSPAMRESNSYLVLSYENTTLHWYLQIKTVESWRMVDFQALSFPMCAETAGEVVARTVDHIAQAGYILSGRSAS